MDHVRISGTDYTRLSVWARSHAFVIHWLERYKKLQLSKSGTRLMFVMNSREAAINGVQVWLAFPLVYRGGTAYVSDLDLGETLTPVLSPKKNSSRTVIDTICLDPGHGGSDPGNHVGKQEEKKYTLLLAQELRGQLERAGFKVVMTRTRDTYPDLSARARAANRGNADLFVSLHFNSTQSSRNSVKGVETYCLTPTGATSTNAGGKGNTRRVPGNQYDDKGMLLAYEVQKAMTKELSTEDRGVRRARFQVLREAEMPAILVEGGFMSHPVEGKKIFDAGYRRQLAKAIVDGVKAYKRQVTR